MNQRNGMHALVYFIVTGLWLYIGVKYLLPYGKQLYSVDLAKQLWAFLMLFLAYGGLGFLLGFSKLKASFKGRGKWFVDFPRLLLIGLPCLYICIMPILPSAIWLDEGVLGSIFSSYKIFFYILLGHTITTSFYRRS